MPRLITFPNALFMCLAVLSMLGAGRASGSGGATAANLIGDPGVEKPAAGGLPAGWSAFSSPGDGFRIGAAEGGRLGRYALRIEGTGTYGGATNERVPTEPANCYAARAWVRVEPGGEPHAYIKLDYFDASGKFLGDTARVDVPNSTDQWQIVAAVGDGRRFPTAASVSLCCGMGGSGAVRFDDLELVRRGASADGNLLSDGGMECVAQGQPTRWHLAQAPGGSVRLIRRTVPVMDGWYSLQARGTAQWAVVESEGVPLDRAKRYRLTGWLRVRVGSVRLRLSYFNGDKYLGGSYSQPVADNQWHEVAVTDEAAKFPDATSMTAAVEGGGQFDAFADGFLLRAE